MENVATLRLDEIEKEVMKNYVNNKSLQRIFKRKRNGTLKTYSHKEVWRK